MTVRVWEATTGKEIARINHDGWVSSSVAFSPDGKYVVSGGYITTDNSFFGIAKVWEVATGKEIAHINYSYTENVSISFSPDGKYIVSGLGNGGEFGFISVWETATGKEVTRMTPASDSIVYAAFSPDGKYVVSGGYDATVRKWELATGKEVLHMTHDDFVMSVAFSPDGKYILSASKDNTVRVWDAVSGKEVARMTYDGAVQSAAFSPDGKYIVSGGSDKTVHIWLYRPEDLIAYACSHVNRNLNHEEWTQYIGDALPYQKICPDLPFDLTYIDTIAQTALANTDDPNRIKTALDQVEAEWKKYDSIKDPRAEAFKTVGAVVVQQISTDAYAGNTRKDKIESAIDLWEQTKQAQIEIKDADALNNLCWGGSLQGYAKPVLPACEEAVKLSPNSTYIRDSRGLARALSGNIQGAILDFQYVVDNDSGDWVKERRQWIEDLKAGKNPFTPEVLESLKSG
jgi:Tol biopolymer transport system component